MKTILLNRNDFRESVFKRDNHKCVVCDQPAVDAHHIIDRSLFDDGGYFIDNGVSLCEKHHIEAEQTIISCSELRDLAKIKNIIYPDYLSLNEFVKDYDKWANPILKDGRRLKGYIFNQPNVQKMIKPVIHLFEKKFDMIVDKYPRSYHVTTSPGTTSDDRISKNIKRLTRGRIIMSEKMDGSNTSLNRFGVYGRSRTSPSANPWDAWLKPYWEMMKNDLGNLEICGENMYGVHSLEYSNLDSYFYVFGIRDTERDIWLSWEEVEFYAKMLDFPTVPVLFKSDKDFNVDESWIYNKIDELMSTPSTFSNDDIITPKEGIVTRIADEFPNDMFFNSLAKWVRKGHVTTDQHWSKNWKIAKLNK
ncbi:hypothetical protein M0Q50_09845 [bacterium]|jgi:hypothetical protein|nr:hypothetical protein [bacterium]